MKDRLADHGAMNIGFREMKRKYKIYFKTKKEEKII